MTRDDIIRWAKQSGWKRVGRNSDSGPEFPILIENLERFAAFVATAERKECVKACEKLNNVFLSNQFSAGQPWSSISERFAVRSCIEAIQAREEPHITQGRLT